MSESVFYRLAFVGIGLIATLVASAFFILNDWFNPTALIKALLVVMVIGFLVKSIKVRQLTTQWLTSSSVTPNWKMARRIR